MTLRAPCAAPRTCSAIAPRSASLPTVTGSDVASRSASSCPNGTSTQPRFGANRTRPSECRTTPHTPTPMPTQTESGAAPASTERVSRSTWRRIFGGLVLASGLAHLAPVEHFAAQTDPGHDQVVDADVERQDVHPLGLRPDHDRRPPGPAPTDGSALVHQPRVGEVGGQRADGAAVQPGQRGEVRARRRAVDMQEPQQAAQVVPAHLVLGGAGQSRGHALGPLRPLPASGGGRAPARDRVDAGCEQQHQSGHDELDAGLSA